MERHCGRLHLENIATALKTVETHWREIDDELDRRGLGRKDTPFDAIIKMRMMSAYSYLDDLLSEQMPPFSAESIEPMLQLNHRVHYGTDRRLLFEYHKAVEATAEKFYQHIGPIQEWYQRHIKWGRKPLKLAAEIYVSILGHPQLYIEGNHRTGTLIANWISVYHGFPPFVLCADNAIAYFAPSTEIQNFADKSTWRGQAKLPRYRKSFLHFWENHIDSQYLIPTNVPRPDADAQTTADRGSQTDVGADADTRSAATKPVPYAASAPNRPPLVLRGSRLQRHRPNR